MRLPKIASLKYRIALIVFSLEVALLAFILTQTLNFIEKHAYEEMQQRHEVAFQLVKSISQNSLSAGEYEDLQTFIDTISTNKEILNVTVVSDSGIVVAHSSLENIGQVYTGNIHPQSDKWLYDEIEELGKILVQFSNQSQMNYIAEAKQLGLTLAITGIIIITCVSLLFGIILTRRLKVLSTAVKNFKHDGKNIQIDVTGADEIAMLGDSFNFMKTEIDRYIVKLNRNRTELEERVMARTQDLLSVQDQLIQNNRELKILSTTDKLTGIFNRAFLEDSLTMEIARTLRDEQTFGVILIDIDHFKLVNDTYGHDEGDQVITLIAKTITKSIREVDIVGRWGGEEFLVICPETENVFVLEIAHRIHKAIAKCNSPISGSVTASLGIAMHLSGESQETTIKHADLALYNAKNSGRNNIKVYTHQSDIIASV